MIESLHLAGCSDAEIAVELGCCRSLVSRHRRRLGLPSHAYGTRHRAKISAGIRRQCERWGVASVAEVRGVIFRVRAIKAGWPVDLKPREIQILELLAERGPMSRMDIAATIGLSWRGKHTFGAAVPGGSYLAHLVRRGLILDLGRLDRVTGQGKGHSRHLYGITIDAGGQSS